MGLNNDLSIDQDFGFDYHYDFSNDNYLIPFKESSFMVSTPKILL